MSSRQHTNPLVVSGGEAVRLHRMPFGERTFDERWLQELLFKHPTLIPVDEIEPAFGPLVSVAREVPTAAGPFDLLYVTATGYPTLVETKLWRNPEARRQVVSQAIDYAKELASWSYEDLVKAVVRSQGAMASDDPVWGAVAEDEADQRSFIDTLGRNLARGRFLLLIVGDGIHHGVEQMAAYLQRTPSLDFTLALVEMALFHLDSSKDGPMLVQPRVVARTREVVRAVVRVEEPPSAHSRISVELPAEDGAKSRARTTITAEAFRERLTTSQHGGKDVAAFAMGILEKVEELDIDGLHIAWMSSGPSIRYTHPETGHSFSFGAMQSDGQLPFLFHAQQYERAGIATSIGLDARRAIQRWVPGSELMGPRQSVRHPGRYGRNIHIRDMMPNDEQWLKLIEQTIGHIRNALGSEE